MSIESILFRDKFFKDLEIAEEKCREVDKVLLSLGDLREPTIETVKEVVRRCTDVEGGTGFLFFARAFCYVPHPTRGKISMRESMYAWQKVASLQFLKGTKFLSKKTRQVGNTSFVSIYFLWRALFYSNTTEYILSIGARESSEVLGRINFTYENLPKWLKTPLLEGAKTSITFKNTSKIKALPGTPEATRGSSLSCSLLDEFAFQKNADRILSSTLPALSMGFLTPFTNKSMPSQLFLISTLPLVDVENNEYVRIYKEILNGQNKGFELLFVSTHDIPEYQNEDWLAQMRQTLGEKRFSVEILGEMNSSLDNSFLPEHIVKELKPLPPIRTDFLKKEDVDEEGYAADMSNFLQSREYYDPGIGYIKDLWIWRDPIPGRVYGMSCDVSAGVGGDYSAFVVFDIEDGYQVAEYYSNKVPLEDFKCIIKDVAEYYNGCLLSIERNSMGASICSFFADTIQYENFYWHRKSKTSYTAGFPVSSGNKGNILAAMQKLFMDKYFKINSIRLINELRSFGFDGKGSIRGLNGVHDDLVMAIAQFSFLKETFFSSSSTSDFSDEFLKSVEEEEERIRKSHYSMGVFAETNSREDELRNLMAGYSVDPSELKRWKKENSFA